MDQAIALTDVQALRKRARQHLDDGAGDDRHGDEEERSQDGDDAHRSPRSVCAR